MGAPGDAMPDDALVYTIIHAALQAHLTEWQAARRRHLRYGHRRVYIAAGGRCRGRW